MRCRTPRIQRVPLDAHPRYLAGAEQARQVLADGGFRQADPFSYRFGIDLFVFLERGKDA
jgi:hypothetical protein